MRSLEGRCAALCAALSLVPAPAEPNPRPLQPEASERGVEALPGGAEKRDDWEGHERYPREVVDNTRARDVRRHRDPVVLFAKEQQWPSLAVRGFWFSSFATHGRRSRDARSRPVRGTLWPSLPGVDNKQTVRSFVDEAVNGGRDELIEELCMSDITDWVREWFGAFGAPFPTCGWSPSSSWPTAGPWSVASPARRPTWASGVATRRRVGALRTSTKSTSSPSAAGASVLCGASRTRSTASSSSGPAGLDHQHDGGGSVDLLEGCDRTCAGELGWCGTAAPGRCWPARSPCGARRASNVRVIATHHAARALLPRCTTGVSSSARRPLGRGGPTS